MLFNEFTMIGTLFVSFCLITSFSSAEETHQLLTTPGQCSQKCTNISQNQVNQESGLPLFTCSCSSSCSLYRDCCHDSEFRASDPVRVRHPAMCLTISGKGQVRAVWKCPRDWNESSQFCTESTGHLPPVTSTSSGITYANIYCAVCHGDGDNLKTWEVELRCCPEREDADNTSHKSLFYRRGYLWRRLSQHSKCLCRYYAHDNDTSFLDSLELRTCNKRTETSRCSTSWTGEDEERLCRSFLDPVYVGDKIYRNIYCAQCNFERLTGAKCMPSIVQQKLGEGLDMERISQFCTRHNLVACMHYYTSNSRGGSYSFANLMNINERTCVPTVGRRCCQGQRYDFKNKRCRPLH